MLEILKHGVLAIAVRNRTVV